MTAPVVTDAHALGVMVAVYEAEMAGGADRATAMGAALEAAAPLLGPRPLLDREAVFAAVRGAGYERPTGEAVDAVMKLARPMPTWEQINEALREFGHEEDGSGWVLFADSLDDIAGAVMALINGGAE